MLAAATPAFGVLLSLAAAALWAVSPLLMAAAGRRVGSFPVVLLRSLVATAVLGVAVMALMLIHGDGLALPDRAQTGWLVLSGVIGMGIGDVMFYESLVTLGPRRTTQVQVLAPAVTVVLAWMFLGEKLSFQSLAGIVIIMAGTSYAVLKRPRPERAAIVTDDVEPEPPVHASDVARAPDEGSAPQESRAARVAGEPPAAQKLARARTPPATEPGRVTLLGLLFAAGGAACAGIGAVTGRQAFRGATPPDAVAATFVRVAGAGVALWLVPVAAGKGMALLRHLRKRDLFVLVLVGTLVGATTGMLCYVTALKHAEAGLVSTLSSMSPLFILPIIAVKYRARIGWDVVLAGVAAMGGVGLLFM